MWNSLQPKQLFLIDALGAILSALLLGLVLTQFESVFGMPQDVLYVLSVIPCFFAVYSFLCFLYKTEKWRFFMKIIAIANLLYCVLTAVLMIYWYQKLTVLGFIYFISEIIVVVFLALIELKTARSTPSV